MTTLRYFAIKALVIAIILGLANFGRRADRNAPRCKPEVAQCVHKESK